MKVQYFAHRGEPIQNLLEAYSNECNVGVKNCKALLNYDVSCEIFDDKVSFMASFMDRFKKEVEGEICLKI